MPGRWAEAPADPWGGRCPRGSVGRLELQARRAACEEGSRRLRAGGSVCTDPKREPGPAVLEERPSPESRQGWVTGAHRRGAGGEGTVTWPQRGQGLARRDWT